MIPRRAVLVGVAVLVGAGALALVQARRKVVQADRPSDAIPSGGNVVVIVCDTLRADHLGLYGYARPTSPFLDSLAGRSWVYENAYSHYSFTWPSIANLFTGLPYSQLVRQGLFTRPVNELGGGGLSPRNSTLAQRLVAAGIPTVGISANPYVTSSLGFGNGFTSFHDIYSWNPSFWNQAIHKYAAEEVDAAAAVYLDRLVASKGPWFLYLQYFDPHMPYIAPPADRALFEAASYHRAGRVVDGYLRDPQGRYLTYLKKGSESWVDRSDLDYLVAQYDAEIHHLDRGLEKLFEILESKGLLDRTTVIITGDHGEAFMERRFWGHGFLSRAEEEHVPLIVVPPRQLSSRGSRIRDVTTTTDIYYSLLRYFGLPAEEPSTSPWWTVDLLSRRRRNTVAYSEGAWDTAILRSTRYSYYLHTGLSRSDLGLPVLDGEYLFDLGSDPAEKTDLFLDQGQRSAKIRQELTETLGAGVSLRALQGVGEPFRGADEESKRRLRALGYLQ